MKNMNNKENGKIKKGIYKSIGNIAMNVWDQGLENCTILGVYEPEISLDILLEDKIKDN